MKEMTVEEGFYITYKKRLWRVSFIKTFASE